MVALSVLDLAYVPEGSSPAEALHNARALAKHAERLGYKRFWLAEHHNMPGIASAATAVAIGYVAEGTRTIRVGSGGIMLPNHSPLLIAEQFGTLATLYPGRIDLGLGRAPGTDFHTIQAMRRSLDNAENFPQDVVELQALLGPLRPHQLVQAVPGADTNVPIWILGSSTYGAQLAAMLGLPFGFASHFAPAMLDQALEIYRARFRPSEHLERPYAMVGVSIVAADTDGDARRLFTSAQQSSANIVRGARGRLPPPIDDIETYWTPQEKAHASSALAIAVVGSPDTVKRGIADLVARTGADELMVTAAIHHFPSRLRSYEIVAQTQADARADGPRESAA